MHNSGCVTGDIGNDDFLTEMGDIIKEQCIDVVIIDPLISFIKVSENDNCKMRELLDNLFAVIKSANASLILVHHVSKSGNTYSQGGRGAQAISDWAPNIIKLSHARGSKDGKKIIFHHEKARNFKIKKTELTLYRDENLWFTTDPITDCNILEEKGVLAVKALQDHGKPFNSQKDFIAAMMSSSDVKKTEAQRRITAAVESGSIIATDIPGSRSKSYALSQ
jgi:RecA-family ATPase